MGSGARRGRRKRGAVEAVLRGRSPGPGVFDLYYQTGWPQVYLHYSHDGQPWNSIPGTAFAASTNASFPASQGWWFVEVAGNEVTWVTTNGQGQWDNNNGRNYQVNSPGIYSLENGQVTTIATFPPGCPQENGQTCDGHGVCNTTTYTCSCSSGYWGVTCDGVCPGAPSSICNGHGACDPTSGACDCYTGWATCGGSGANSTLCTTNVQTDPYNCGGCNVTCLPDPGGGVARATCANSTCTRVCVSGWTLCPDGNCYEGSTCPLPGCDTFDVPGTQCVGDNITMPVSLEAARWQTPVRGSAEWLPGFQDYAFLVGHMQLVYSADHQWVNASVVALTRFSNVTLQASFNGSAFSPQLWATFAAPASGPISVVVRGSDGSVLALDEFDFIWDHPAVVPQDPSGDYRNGTKGGIVELWGWPYDDIAQECQAIANAGWLGIKIPTPQEHLFSTEPFQNVMNPWFFSYQPVSLRLQGRFGNRTSLRNMINSCRSVGVRVYADAVLNHMVGSGNDYAALHRIDSGGSCVTWPNKTSTAADPAYFITQDFEFVPNPNTGLPPTQEFPAVPYGPLQFHCERALNSWNDPLDLNAGWLDGLVDINTEDPTTQARIADYMVDLLSIGFSGFRMDAAKHMQPDDIAAFFGLLKQRMGGALPVDMVAYLEVLTGGEADMLLCDTNSGYNFAVYLEQALLNQGLTQSEVDNIKIWADFFPASPGADCGMLSMTRKAIEMDDNDMQVPGDSRDCHGTCCVLVLDCDSADTHRGFEVELFTAPPGSSDNMNDYPIRLLLSSYYPLNGGPGNGSYPTSYGPPDGLSSCALCTTECTTCQTDFPYVKAYVANATSYAGPYYTRTHRDLGIVNAMRSWMNLPPIQAVYG